MQRWQRGQMPSVAIRMGTVYHVGSNPSLCVGEMAERNCPGLENRVYHYDSGGSNPLLSVEINETFINLCCITILMTKEVPI